MFVDGIKTDSIRLLKQADRTPANGLSVSLLPDGATAPGGLISLTENADINWQYDFPVSITNGRYTVYINGLPMAIDGEDVLIEVQRNGKSDPVNTNYLSDYDGG